MEIEISLFRNTVTFYPGVGYECLLGKMKELPPYQILHIMKRRERQVASAAMMPLKAPLLKRTLLCYSLLCEVRAGTIRLSQKQDWYPIFPCLSSCNESLDTAKTKLTPKNKTERRGPIVL